MNVAQTGENTSTAEAKLPPMLVEVGEISLFQWEDWATGMRPHLSSSTKHSLHFLSQLSRRYFKQLLLLQDSAGSSSNILNWVLSSENCHKAMLDREADLWNISAHLDNLEISQGISEQYTLSHSLLLHVFSTSAWLYPFTVNPSLWCHVCGTEREKKHRTHLKLHDYIIKFFISSTADKSANMILPCKETETYRVEHETITSFRQMVSNKHGNLKRHQAGSSAEQINFVFTSQSHISGKYWHCTGKLQQVETSATDPWILKHAAGYSWECA